VSTDIPYAKLGISSRIEEQLSGPGAARVKLPLARGLLPLGADEQLGVLTVLSGDADAAVASAARQSLEALPARQVLGALSLRTHPKVLELLVELRPADAELDERIALLRTANDRTVLRIAARAPGRLCESLCRNHERLVMTPALFVALHANPACSDSDLASAEAFLRMQRSLPAVPALRPFLAESAASSPASSGGGGGAAPSATPPPPAAGPAAAPAAPRVEMDLLAEIEAALRGESSPAFRAAQESDLELFRFDDSPAAAPGAADPLAGFRFDFKEDDDFGDVLTQDISEGDGTLNEKKLSIERQIQAMSPGKKIKLAYSGNKEARGVLIRDANKIVASAVVKSGRLSDGEVATYAGNKNLSDDVIREIAINPEFTRKYPVKVALVNNPKTPASLAVSMVKALQKKDLMMLARNRNVPSAVVEAASRLFNEKYRGAKKEDG
jgi:hypothetical protein